MGDKSRIAWTNATWNPVRGCTPISEGCQNCYARAFAERFRGVSGHPYEQGFDVRLVRQLLDQPLRWKRPRLVFVNSMSDLFHDAVPVEYIAQVFATMAQAQQHTFQLLTKRHERMERVLGDIAFENEVRHLLPDHGGDLRWPLPNLWLGVTTENQRWARERIPALLRTPAALRWISAEPLLGPLVIYASIRPCKGIDWVIAGGESGPRARPMALDWARDLLEQCRFCGVPFFFKQMGHRAYDAQIGGHEVVAGQIRSGDPEGRELENIPADLRIREYPEVHHAH